MKPTDKEMIDYLHDVIRHERERFELRIKPYVEQLIKLQNRNSPNYWLKQDKITLKVEE